MTEEAILTKDKYEQLKEELDFLLNTKRQEIANQIDAAKSLGDLSENAEYHEARAAQARVEDRIRTLEELLKYARVIEHKRTDIVEVGSTVKLQKKGTTSEQTLTIAGSEESDIMKGLVSFSSPMGQALVGKSAGDHVQVTTPSGTVEYTIISIEA
jgi:transcription elongation factor GreA